MLYPIHVLIFASFTLSVAVWGLLLLWALRSGLFRSSGEAVKYRVFDDSDG